MYFRKEVILTICSMLAAGGFASPRNLLCNSTIACCWLRVNPTERFTLPRVNKLLKGLCSFWSKFSTSSNVVPSFKPVTIPQFQHVQESTKNTRCFKITGKEYRHNLLISILKPEFVLCRRELAWIKMQNSRSWCDSDNFLTAEWKAPSQHDSRKLIRGAEALC